jgi:hypothetical protein
MSKHKFDSQNIKNILDNITKYTPTELEFASKYAEEQQDFASASKLTEGIGDYFVSYVAQSQGGCVGTHTFRTIKSTFDKAKEYAFRANNSQEVKRLDEKLRTVELNLDFSRDKRYLF